MRGLTERQNGTMWPQYRVESVLGALLAPLFGRFL
jgi:hypothetical protein